MGRRDEWQKVLDAEVERWSAKSCDELMSELRDIRAYEVELASQTYQVEVELLEDTKTYLHVLVAVDDGYLPASFRPLSRSFIREKPGPAR